MQRRVLITGGSGFIGTNLIEFFRKGESVVVQNYDIAQPRCAGHREYWVSGDLLDAQRLREVIVEFQPTELVHLAARTDLDGKTIDDYKSNTEGVENVLKCSTASRALKRTIYASSRLVCDISEAPSSDFDYYPPNMYGRSKVIGEQLVRGNKHSSDWLIVRPTSIWGPWFETPYRDFFMTLARGRYLNPGKESVPKSFGYVGNTVFQLNRLLTSESEAVNGRTLYLADYEAIDVPEFAAAIRARMGLTPPRSAPVPLLFLAAKAGDALQKLRIVEHSPLTTFRLRNLRTSMVFDLTSLADIVGAVPFSTEEGIDITVDYLHNDGSIQVGTKQRVAI